MDMEMDKEYLAYSLSSWELTCHVHLEIFLMTYYQIFFTTLSAVSDLLCVLQWKTTVSSNSYVENSRKNTDV